MRLAGMADDMAEAGPMAAATAYFNRLAEASQDCMWLLGTDGRVRYMNGRATRLLGLPPGVTRAPSFHDLWPAETRATLERALASAAGGQPQTFRAFFGGADGARAYWDTLVSPVTGEDDKVTQLVAVSRDVTETVETQAFLQSVIQLLPAPLTVKTVQDRRYILMNRAAEDLMDLLPDEGLGRTAEELLPPEQAAALVEADAQVLSTGEMMRLDHQTRGRGGEVRDFTFKLLATHDDLGPRHLIAIGDDVTERKAAAESLAAALQAAEQASRAKSAFIANMSHEIRTPLNGVMAGADMLGRADPSPGTAELVAMIRASSEALNRLLTDILEIARAESGEIVIQPEPFEVGEAVRAVAAPYGLAAERKGLALELRIADDLDGAALGDVARLRQVLTNLLSNAVKFTDRGRIVLEAVRPAPDMARFSLCDTGIGFDPADKARLFDRFHQADASFTRRFEGAGLGLAIAKDLVERMGGRLDAEGRAGEGSKFWFEIPLPPVDASARGAGEATPPAPGMRVLLADDHPTNRQVIQLMMAGMADVVSVENGAEAVAAFRDAPFDLVLMDMQMPVMDGLAAIRELRRLETARGSDRTPMVMISANALPEHRAASAAAGADRHLAKPITVQTLFAAIESALDPQIPAEGDARRRAAP